MTILDERGRVAGRFNVVDMMAGVILLGAVPLAFGAYLLFRTPPPTLASIAPRTAVAGSTGRIEIDGTNLRPFMRVSFDTVPAKAFLLGSETYALVDLPDLAPGVYDVVLYDYMREVARLPKALTIAPIAADVQLDLVGAFAPSSREAASALKAGDRLGIDGGVAEVISIGDPVAADLRLRVGADTIRVQSAERELPATLRVKCAPVQAEDGAARCVVPLGDARVVVAPDALLTLPTPRGPVLFQITSARAPDGHAVR